MTVHTATACCALAHLSVVYSCSVLSPNLDSSDRCLLCINSLRPNMSTKCGTACGFRQYHWARLPRAAALRGTICVDSISAIAPLMLLHHPPVKTRSHSVQNHRPALCEQKACTVWEQVSSVVSDLMWGGSGGFLRAAARLTLLSTLLHRKAGDTHRAYSASLRGATSAPLSTAAAPPGLPACCSVAPPRLLRVPAAPVPAAPPGVDTSPPSSLFS